MLLRASSKAVALQVQEEATMGGDGSALVEAGEDLVAFGEALTLGSDKLDASRARLRSKVGEATFIEAAAIAAIDAATCCRHCYSLPVTIQTR